MKGNMGLGPLLLMAVLFPHRAASGQSRRILRKTSRRNDCPTEAQIW